MLNLDLCQIENVVCKGVCDEPLLPSAACLVKYEETTSHCRISRQARIGVEYIITLQSLCHVATLNGWDGQNEL
jgi:hypothetical protein